MNCPIMASNDLCNTKKTEESSTRIISDSNITKTTNNQLPNLELKDPHITSSNSNNSNYALKNDECTPISWEYINGIPFYLIDGGHLAVALPAMLKASIKPLSSQNLFNTQSVSINASENSYIKLGETYI